MEEENYFRLISKTNGENRLLVSFWLYVCPYGTTGFQLSGFSRNCVFGSFDQSLSTKLKFG